MKNKTINQIEDEHEVLIYICNASFEDLIFNREQINKLTEGFI